MSEHAHYETLPACRVQLSRTRRPFQSYNYALGSFWWVTFLFFMLWNACPTLLCPLHHDFITGGPGNKESATDRAALCHWPTRGPSCKLQRSCICVRAL